jgi:hypothetical protein
MKSGDRIELLEDLAIDNTELRWEKSVGSEPFLHSGQYIVEYATEGEVRLADAEWDEKGRITFHSTKHRHVVKGEKAIEFLEKSVRK